MRFVDGQGAQVFPSSVFFPDKVRFFSLYMDQVQSIGWINWDGRTHVSRLSQAASCLLGWVDSIIRFVEYVCILHLLDIYMISRALDWRPSRDLGRIMHWEGKWLICSEWYTEGQKFEIVVLCFCIVFITLYVLEKIRLF